jgi:hypothetical protein
MCSQEIASTQYDTEKEYLIRTVRNKRDFNEQSNNKYTKEDSEKAFAELNIDFCKPKLSLLEEVIGYFELLSKIKKVKFNKENKTK